MNSTIEDILLDLFHQIIVDPDRIPAVPTEDWPEDSRQRCLLTSFREVIERLQQRQQERLDTQGRFWLAVQGANDGLWDRHISSDEYHLSTRWKSMLGYDEQEIADDVEEWRKRIHPDDLDQALATGRAYIDGETDTYEIEYRLRHKDGTYRWILARGAALRDVSGRAYRLAGSNTDITDRKLAEQQLREREEQYRSIFEAASDAMFISDLNGNIVEANPAACQMYGYSHQEFIGLPTTATLHPNYHHLIAESLQVIQSGGQVPNQLIALRKDGTTFPVEARGTAFTYLGKPHILGIARDITERVQAQQILEQRVEERTRELATLLDVSHDVASTLELKPLLNLILNQIKDVVEYTAATILILDGDELVIVDYLGPIQYEETLPVRSPVRTIGVNDIVLRQGGPVIIDDVLASTPLAQDYREALGDMLQIFSSNLHALMVVPLKLKDRLIGMLSLSSSEVGCYTPHHVSLIVAIANQAAIAIENARLYAQAQDLAALEERQKLARELHDSVSQALYSIALGLHTARIQLERDPRELPESLDYLLSLADAGLTEMRALIFELRPESLETTGMVSALLKQAAALEARHEIAISTDLCDEPDLPLRIKQELYRIAQEALHNIVKHAHANKVVMRMEHTSDGIMMEVCDDGVGFDTTAAFPGHLGLHSMHERVANLGGTFQIESTPGAGTRICVRIPGHE
jgi:PAS domain S-box-containing protein